MYPPPQHSTETPSARSDSSTASSPPSSTSSPRSSRQAALAPALSDFAQPLADPSGPSSYYSSGVSHEGERPSFDGFTDGGFGSSASDSFSCASGPRSPSAEEFATPNSNAYGSAQLSSSSRFDYTQELYSSRAGSPVPRLGSWDALSPRPSDQLLAYRTATSRNRSRNASGTTTPTFDKEAQFNPDYYNSHHHQTSALLRKLGGTSPPDNSPVLTHKKRKPGWWSRRAEIKRKNSISNGSALLPQPTTKSSRHSKSCLSAFGAALLRQPWVPTQPLTILFAFLLLGCFAASLTTFLVHVLSSDKQRLPWRDYCQKQRPFPHALADSLAPVSVFVGVFSVDERESRRNAIRQTYMTHSRPVDPTTGQPSLDVQVKFILGRPRPKWSKRIALEMEMYNDIVVLDIDENMNHGKTHSFFTWANENATVPVYYQRPEGTAGAGQIGVGFQRVDYVAKADDDTFIVLSELERHLRIAPRNKLYWGYLVRDFFMAGELYVLSQDLVEWVATYPLLKQFTVGKEDQRTANWIRTKHPQKEEIRWVSERCYIYDHPKAPTTYAHGFLFPDEVERVRAKPVHGLEEASYSTVSKWKVTWTPPVDGLTVEEEVEALVEGGGRWSQSGWKAPSASSAQGVPVSATYFAPLDARLKGLPRDNGPDPNSSGVTPGQPDPTENLPSARSTRFGKDLYRDPSDVAAVRKIAKRGLEQNETEDEDEDEVYNLVPGPHVDEDDEVLASSAEESLPSSGSSAESPSTSAESSSEQPTTEPATSTSYENTTTPATSDSDEPTSPVENLPTGKVRVPSQAYIVPPADAPEAVVPPPSLRYDASALEVRAARMLGRPHGGTVAVHYLKRTEWFYETALALLGREKMWDSGTPAPFVQRASMASAMGGAQEIPDFAAVRSIPPWTGKGTVEVLDNVWGSARRFGSPLVREDGYVAEGRPAQRKVEATQQPTGKWGRFSSSPRLALAVPGAVEEDVSSSSAQPAPLVVQAKVV